MEIRFIFVGRICKEKGVDLILQSVSLLNNAGITNFRIDFFGSGVMVDVIQNHIAFGTQLFYHGRLPKEQIIPVWQEAHYTLMPSHFLETFGLVALDSLSLGVPVISEKKGGVAPFLIDESLIYTGKGLFDTMKQAIQKFELHNRQKISSLVKEKVQEYDKKHRIDRFRQLSKNCKKCILVSDYAIDIGGIENYLLQTKTLLHTHHIATDLYGKTKKVTGIRRKIDLFAALCNVVAASGLFKQIKNESYELIWMHSVQRWLGWFSIFVIKFLKRKQKYVVRTMFHDFGMYHPFPSGVYTEAQLITATTFTGYMKEGKNYLGSIKRFLGGFFLVLGKRCMTKRLLFRMKSTSDFFLVPSAYMIPYTQKLVGYDTIVIDFPHFVSHTSLG